MIVNIKTGSQVTAIGCFKTILDLLRKNSSLGRKEIAEMIGDITEDGVKYHLGKLKQDGKIKRVGGDKGGHWKVQD